MAEPLSLTRAQLAERTGFSQSVIRKYESVDFADFVTSPPGKKNVAQAKRYNEQDVVLFLTIAELKREGLSLDAIRQALPERLLSARAKLDEGLVTVRELLPPSAKGEQQSVSLALYMEVARSLENAEGELSATKAERDYLRERVEQLERVVVDEVAKRAAAEVQRDVALASGKSNTSWLRRLFGGSEE